MVGTTEASVARVRSICSTKRSAAKRSDRATGRRAIRQRVTIDRPPTCATVMHANQQSSSRQPRFASLARADATNAARDNTAARGSPVVPEVKRTAAASS